MPRERGSGWGGCREGGGGEVCAGKPVDFLPCPPQPSLGTPSATPDSLGAHLLVVFLPRGGLGAPSRQWKGQGLDGYTEGGSGVRWLPRKDFEFLPLFPSAFSAGAICYPRFTGCPSLWLPAPGMMACYAQGAGQLQTGQQRRTGPPRKT